nr:hypothetical protein [uncultured Pseudomonas sp.]
MPVLTQSLYIAGCIPFLILGLLHTAYTIADIRNPKRLIPYKSGVMGLMKESTLALTKETDMWRAWIGFNISHGVGVLFFAITLLYLAVLHIAFLQSSIFLLTVSPLIALVYLLLSRKYWFRIPAAGSAIGLLCFLAGSLAQAFA